jgi:methyl-accepting chemotaxis protein
MSRNVSEAAGGAAQIARSVDTMADASRQVSDGASASRQAAAELTGMANDLRALVGRFRC